MAVSVRKWPVVGLLLAGLWVFVRGVALDPRAVAVEFLAGLAVGLAVAYAFRRMYLPTVDLGRDLRVLPTAALYVAVFLKEVIVANFDVAYRVLHPRMPIEPDVVEVPLRVETDAAVTTIANSITLTPGTLTMDHDPETNTLYVHGIIGRRREQVLAPIRRWEDLLLVIFDEGAAPDEEPPLPGDEPPSPGERRATDEADPDARTRASRSSSATDDPGETSPPSPPEDPGGGADGG